jgi:hypothetical protein
MSNRRKSMAKKKRNISYVGQRKWLNEMAEMAEVINGVAGCVWLCLIPVCGCSSVCAEEYQCL